MAFYVDPDKCIGCGLCTGIAPEVFAMTESGLAEAVAQPGPGETARAQEALESCPVAAIGRN